jgi:hypothetical protein
MLFIGELIGSPMKWGRKKPHIPITNIASPLGEKKFEPLKGARNLSHWLQEFFCLPMFFVILGLG